jgi:hypothetical protein
VKEKHSHWNIEVVATAMGMMGDVGIMVDDGRRCSASIFGMTTILVRMTKKRSITLHSK